MENKYYIYVYLDPRKAGKYVYGKYSFKYEPIYVGKGHNNRYQHHLKDSELNKLNGNVIKQNKLKKILKEGLKPINIKTKTSNCVGWRITQKTNL